MDCYPAAGANEGNCLARGCCWNDKSSIDSNIPSCYFPLNYPTYKVVSKIETPRGYVLDLNKETTSQFGLEEFHHVQLEIRHETKTRLRLRFTTPLDPNRWEPPIPLGEPDKEPPSNTDYDTVLTNSPFGIKIVRKSLQRQVLLDSSGDMSPSFIFSNQFLQIAFKLNDHLYYGPGELRTDIHARNQWIRSGLWARDHPPQEFTNLYGVHNMIMGIDHSGLAFGIFLLNSNAQEVVRTPLPSVTYRTIGGIMDFFILTGPKPIDVIRQYYDLIGHPPVPPYWSLGYQLSRYGYRDLDEVKVTLKRNLEYGIPVDVQWFDIDYMDKYKVWTVNQTSFGDLGEFVSKTLHAEYNIRAVFIIDPGISTNGGPGYATYTTGLDLGVFVKDDRTGQPIRGMVWPGESVFPDFSHPNAENWWYNEAHKFHQEVPFDGLWNDMNEPASFYHGSTTGCDQQNELNHPPFVPSIVDGLLYANTICPSAKHHDTTHYNRHNLYGYDHARLTHGVMKKLFPGKRPFILSRSTFAGSGRYVIHWTGDNLSGWKDMKASIMQLIHFNIFGIPMVGADICGFREDADEELCVRWHQLGAFYPFARNHAALGTVTQDPMSWSEQGRSAILDAIQTRYRFLPYLYTLLFRAHLYGEPVIRALAFEYPDDLTAHKIETQFMWGKCILVNPVLYSERATVESYIPGGSWINLGTGKRITSVGKRIILPAPLNVIPILLRAGCIIPIQTSLEVTSVSRKEGLGLMVALSSPDYGSRSAQDQSRASGELFWDDGESELSSGFAHIAFNVTNRVLQIHPLSVRTNLPREETTLKKILIISILQKPSTVHVNNNEAKFDYDENLEALSIYCPYGTQFIEPVLVTWNFE